MLLKLVSLILNVLFYFNHAQQFGNSIFLIKKALITFINIICVTDLVQL